MIRVLTILGCIAGLAVDASAATFHVTGVALDHDARPNPGRKVRASFGYDSCTPAGACTPVQPALWEATTGADGRFDITVELPVQPDPYAKNQVLQVDSFGSEVSIYRKRTVAWNAEPAFWTVDIVVRNVPAGVSVDGGYWARRVGCGEYPVFVVEGFDPSDSMKTGDESDLRSWIGLLAHSPLEGGGNLLDFLTSHNYSVYILSSGTNSGQSIRATDDDLTKGMAYQAMVLAKTILEQSHPGKPLVIGGYSAGGLTARVGLNKWCDGSYEAISGGFLAAGCPEVALWFSGDAPQKGATVPISLQRYMHDDEILGDFTGVSLVQEMLDKPVAQEMLKQSIGDQLCNTNCAGFDMFGCESTDPHFTEECVVRTDVHDAFFAWVGGYPTRAGGGAVPAIAFSLGEAWRDASGAVPRPAYCWDHAAWNGKKFFEADVTCWGNHNLYVNTAGGIDECVPGSVVDSLFQFDGLFGPENGPCPVGGWEIEVHFAPTYITTDSALDWDQRDVRWMDYYHPSGNLNHGGGIPPAAGGFLLSWITEYTTGLQDRPPCEGRPPGKTLGLNQICRGNPGNGAESAQACPLPAEPLQALVATHTYGASTPGVGVLRTTNFGEASPVYAPNNAGLSNAAALDVHGLELDRFDPDVAYAYTADGIYVNPRVWGNGTWTRVLDKAAFEAAAGMSFPTGWGIVHAIPSPTVPGRIHAIVEGNKGTDPIEKRFRYYAMVSHDGGASWSAQQVGQTAATAVGGATAGSFSITPSPTDPAKVWLTAKSSNFGTCNIFYSCSTVWRSTNGGTSWAEVETMRFNYPRTTHLLVPSQGNDANELGYRFREPVGPNDPTLHGSINGLTSIEWQLNPFVQVGTSWANYARRANSFYADPTDHDLLVLLAKNVFLTSTDGGHDWQQRTPPGIGNGDILERGTARWRIAAAASYAYVWNPSLYTTIAYTTDYGATWQKRNGNLKDMTTALTMSLSAVRIRK